MRLKKKIAKDTIELFKTRQYDKLFEVITLRQLFELIGTTNMELSQSLFDDFFEDFINCKANAILTSFTVNDFLKLTAKLELYEFCSCYGTYEYDTGRGSYLLEEYLKNIIWDETEKINCPKKSSKKKSKSLPEK